MAMRDPNAMDVDRSEMVCWTCNKKGHPASRCPQKVNTNTICAYCKQPGHHISDCKAPGFRPLQKRSGPSQAVHMAESPVLDPESTSRVVNPPRTAKEIDISVLSETEIAELNKKLANF